MDDKLAEAERRIEEARRTGAESLDLGDLILSELPASLGMLKDLKIFTWASEFPTSPRLLTGLESARSLDSRTFPPSWVPKDFRFALWRIRVWWT